MKKIYVSGLILLMSGSLSAQVVDNPGFEDAFAGSPFSTSGAWTGIFFSGETSDVGAGSQSGKLTTTDAGAPFGIVGGACWQNINGAVSTPATLVASYMFKYAPAGSDHGVVVVQVLDTLAAGATDDSLLYIGMTEISATSTAWENGMVTVTSNGGVGSANRVIVRAYSSIATYDATSATAAEGGSILLLDEFQLGYAGIKENNAVSVSAFPNPANNTLTITSSEAVANVVVLSMDGKVVATSASSSVNVEMLNAGVYLYEVTTTAGNVVRNNFMKN